MFQPRRNVPFYPRDKSRGKSDLSRGKRPAAECCERSEQWIEAPAGQSGRFDTIFATQKSLSDRQNRCLSAAPKTQCIEGTGHQHGRFDKNQLKTKNSKLITKSAPDTLKSISVIIGLVGPVGIHADVGRLFGRKPCQPYAQSVQMQARHLLVQFFGQAVNAHGHILLPEFQLG